MKASFVLPLLLLGLAGHGAVALARSPDTFTRTGAMTTPRSWHTATLLTNAKVLIAGCSVAIDAPTATAELYDPDSGTCDGPNITGSVPGQIAGLMQVNVQIPAGVEPGGYVPVVLQVGKTSTTPGTVWIAVSGN